MASRPSYSRSITDQPIDQPIDDPPKKKTADVVTTELSSQHGGEGGSSSASDIKKKLPYDDGSGSDSEHGVAEQHYENLVLDDSEIHYTKPAEDALDLVTQIIHVDDDTSLNPWTFRM